MKTTKLLLTIVFFLLSITVVVANPAGTNVVISELHVNAQGSDSGKEFIELYNPTDSPISIAGWKLEASAGWEKTIPAGASIGAKGYYLITNFCNSCGDPNSTWPATWPEPDTRLSYVSLTNSGMGLRLEDSGGTAVDKVGWGSVLSTIYYETTTLVSQSSKSGKSLERKPGELDPNCGNWIDTDVNADDFLESNPTPQNKLNATEETCGSAEDTIPPASITNLANSNVTNSSIRWSWTNPSDPDYDGAILYINGINEANVSAGVTAVDVTGLLANTQYNLTVHTKDSNGNINDTDVTDSVTTLSNVECTLDSQCDNGFYCDGVETCNSGVCQAGTAVVCDNGQFCDGVETCNEVTDSCDAGTPVDVDDSVSCTTDSCDEVNDVVVNTPQDVLCDNGQFCDGTETCHQTLGCQAGTAIDCSDGQFCNGEETCNEATDSCDAGTAPSVDDSVSCTVDSCNEATDSIDHVPTDSLCDNGLYCDGVETCHETLGCQAGTVVDCSGNDISGIDSCTNDPDNNPLTHDTRSAFTSTCNEATDSCEVGDTTVAHACSLTCGAGCASDLDCSVGEVCDLSSCGCVPDSLPKVNITSPLAGALVTTSDVVVQFSTEHWNVSGKGAPHIHFHFNGTPGLSFSDHLMFYNGADQIVEFNTVAGTTPFATWNNANTFTLHNVQSGTHKLRAHLATAGHGTVGTLGADQTIEFDVVLPICGDNVKNQVSEVCDGSDLNSNTCQDFGYSNPSGLSCALTCDGFDTSGCVATCGDGNLEPGEACDDNNLDSGDGCSSTCELEHVDDLQINYLRGKVTFDGENATNGTAYTVEVLEGQNAGLSFNGLTEDGKNTLFDTKDQITFSTNDKFRLTADGCNAQLEDYFANGGNENVHLDCTIDPVIHDVYHEPAVPHDLVDTKVFANVTDDNGNLDTVLLHYSLNETNATAVMVLDSGLYTHNFGILGYNTSVTYELWVNDTYGNMVASAPEAFTVISHDYDKDGVNVSLDCNDEDASIYPGAPEVLDNIDQNCVNDAPEFNGPIPNQTWNEDTVNANAFDLDTFFTDLDNNGELSFTYPSVPNLQINIDENNQVNLTPLQNWFGVETLTITAFDGSESASSNEITLIVESVEDAPQFVGTISDIVVKETEFVRMNASGEVLAEDGDGDDLTYTYNCSPSPCNLDNEGVWETDFGDKGVYTANVTVSDGILTDSQLVQITVQNKFEGDVNEDGQVNILDLIAVRLAFGLTSSDAGWDPDLDVNGDNKIDILDLIFIRTRFT